MKFIVGDRVKWTSQSNSFTKAKEGEIVQVVPAGERPDPDRFKSLYKGAGCGYGRKKESYVINCAPPGYAPKYYWPVPSLLIPV